MSWQKRMARASCWPPAASLRRCSASQSSQVRQLKRATTLLRLNILRGADRAYKYVQRGRWNSMLYMDCPDYLSGIQITAEYASWQSCVRTWPS